MNENTDLNGINEAYCRLQKEYSELRKKYVSLIEKDGLRSHALNNRLLGIVSSTDLILEKMQHDALPKEELSSCLKTIYNSSIEIRDRFSEAQREIGILEIELGIETDKKETKLPENFQE